MNLIPLPALQDNDLWMLHDGRRAVAADPGDAQAVLACLQRDGLQLEAILVMRQDAGQNPAPHQPQRGSGLPGRKRTEPVFGATLSGCEARRTHPYTFGRLAVAWRAEPNNNRLVPHRQRRTERRAMDPQIRSRGAEMELRGPAYLAVRPQRAVRVECAVGGATRQDRVAAKAAGRQWKNDVQ